ncbi:MAG: hypothetical protein WDM71_05955 [Ferruginibacter sp.]
MQKVASALGNRSIGTGAVGGMLTGVLLGGVFDTCIICDFSVFTGKSFTKTLEEKKEWNLD